jgi:hypothetical protein
MDPLRLFPIVALVSIPTVMFGGYALLRFLTRGEGLSEFKQTYFRAGHAHAGVLLILALVYFDYLERTDLGDSMRWSLGVALVVGILAQSGGFFLHMAVGAPGRRSIGTTVTIVGAAILAVAILVLAYGLAVAG